MTAVQPYQPATPDVLAWIASESARGCTRSATYGAMLQAGWSPVSAALALQLTAQEKLALGLSADAVPVPQPVLLPRADVSNAWVVDGGDGAVAVLQRHDDPPVIVFSQLLSADECTALIDAARPRLSASLTVDITTGGEELHPDRTSQGMFFTRGENPVVARLEARMATLLGWPIENGEGLQILRYPPGAQYRPHRSEDVV